MVCTYTDRGIEVGCSPTVFFVQGQDFVIDPPLFQDFTHGSTVQSFVIVFQKRWRFHFYLPTAAAYTLALKSICAGLLITATVSKGFPTPTLWEQ